MTDICIYAENHGLGPCAGPVSRVRVANKRAVAWRGLNDLAERLQELGEAPGVCQAHEPRARTNGFLVGVEPEPSKTTPARTLGRGAHRAVRHIPV